MTPEGFREMIRELMRRGLDREKAGEYAWRIGDTPESDEKGLWVIRDDHGQIIDRIQPIEEEE